MPFFVRRWSRVFAEIYKESSVLKANLWGVLVLSLFIFGCSSIPTADTSLDRKAKMFEPIKDKSLIYVYRNEFMGSAVRMDVLLDNQLLGETRSGHYLYIVAEPGDHAVTSRAENSDTVQLRTEKNKIYFVWQEAKMGIIYAGTKLNIVGEDTGRKGVNECSLIVHNQPR